MNTRLSGLNQQPTAAVAKETPITNQLTQIDSAIEALVSTVSRHEDTIFNVLSASEPESVPEKDDSCCGSPMETRLHDVLTRINRINNRLYKITDRVQL